MSYLSAESSISFLAVASGISTCSNSVWVCEGVRGSHLSNVGLVVLISPLSTSFFKLSLWGGRSYTLTQLAHTHIHSLTIRKLWTSSYAAVSAKAVCVHMNINIQYTTLVYMPDLSFSVSLKSCFLLFVQPRERKAQPIKALHTATDYLECRAVSLRGNIIFLGPVFSLNVPMISSAWQASHDSHVIVNWYITYLWVTRGLDELQIVTPALFSFLIQTGLKIIQNTMVKLPHLLTH